MKVVQLTLNVFLSTIMGESVVLMSENATIVSYLTKQEGTVSRVMCSLALEDRGLVGTAHGNLNFEVHPREEEHASRPIVPFKTNPSH